MALRDALNRFLAGLSPDHRTIFVLRYWASLEIGEIADRCGVSKANVKTILSRTRSKLKDFLDKEGLL